MANSLAMIAFHHNLRAEQIIHLGTMCATDPMSDVAKEAFESNWEEIWDVLALDYPDHETDDCISEHLTDNQRDGFLVEIATPSPRSFSENGSYVHSWGVYRLKWFYGETMEQIYTQAAEWQHHYIEEKRAQALKEQSHD